MRLSAGLKRGMLPQDVVGLDRYSPGWMRGAAVDFEAMYSWGAATAQLPHSPARVVATV
jgi:hypothetical protein